MHPPQPALACSYNAVGKTKSLILMATGCCGQVFIFGWIGIETQKLNKDFVLYFPIFFPVLGYI